MGWVKRHDMSGPKLPTPTAVDRPDDFLFRVDQDSIQFSHRADGMFWLRILSQPVEQRVSVTDLKCSMQSDDSLIKVLRDALKVVAEGRTISGFDFPDIVPRWRGHPNAHEAATAEAARILDLLAVVLDQMSFSIAAYKLLLDDEGKARLSIDTFRRQ